MIGCIIQARMGSTRLPGKVLKKIDDDKIVLDYVIEQLKSSKNINKIFVATSNLDEDDPICSNSSLRNIKFYRGSSEDVLDRYYQCAKQFSIETIVRITADNPLIDPDIVDLVIEKFSNNKCDYATNSLNRTFPYGTEVEVFSFQVLEKAWQNAKLPSEREHVTPFIRDKKNGFNLLNVENNENLSFLRYTVDRLDDLELVREIAKNLSPRPIKLKHILDLYRNNSEIFKINQHVLHDGHLSSLKKDEKFLKSLNENEQ